MTNDNTPRKNYATSALRNMSETQLQQTCRRLGFLGIVETKSRAELEAFWRASKGFPLA